MNETLYLSLACGLFVLFLALWLSRSSRETFRTVDDESGRMLLNTLTQNLASLTDSKKFVFVGELEPLSQRDIMSEISFREGTRSFTENKQNITLCLRNHSGEFYDTNSLMYVALHELAHVINDELQHTAKFRRIFDALLEHAAGVGLYDPSRAFVSNYCL